VAEAGLKRRHAQAKTQPKIQALRRHV
jgi:hypothetical protein